MTLQDHIEDFWAFAYATIPTWKVVSTVLRGCLVGVTMSIAQIHARVPACDRKAKIRRWSAYLVAAHRIYDNFAMSRWKHR